MEIMFETFDVPCMRLEQPAVLALHASGCSSGLVVDCGARLSITPIVMGYVMEKAAHRGYVGGMSVTEELDRLLMDSAVDAAMLEGRGARSAVRKLKEQHGYVLNAAELAAQPAQPQGTPLYWQFGDGINANAMLRRRRMGTAMQRAPTSVRCGGAGELWRAPELLFSDLGDGRGLAAHCAAVVDRCELAARPQLMGHVLLAGGSTGFEGFQDRLQEELSAIWRTTKCRVTAPPNRKWVSPPLSIP